MKRLSQALARTDRLARVLLASLVVMAPSLSLADATTLWTNTTNDQVYGTPGWNDAIAIPDGGFVVCGPIRDGQYSRGLVRCWGIGGNARWTYEFPDNNSDDWERPHKLALAPDGTIVMVGTRDGSPNDILFVRLDTQGNELDRQVVVPTGMSDFNGVGDVEIDGSGNIYVAFEHFSYQNFRLAKFHSDFSLDWETDGTYLHDIELLANGRVAVCGERYAGANQWDAVFALLEANGTLVSGSVLATGNLASGLRIASSNASECYVVTSSGRAHKFSAAGLEEWSVPAIEAYHTRVQYDDRTDTLIVAAPHYLSHDLEVVGYTPAGTERWRTVQGANIYGDEITMEMDRYGNAVIAATVDNQGANQNMRAFCYSANGVQQWQNELTGTGSTHESVRAMALDDKLRLCVAGGMEDIAVGNPFGFAWRTSQYFHGTPDSATIRLGRRILGDMASLVSDDGDEYVVCKFLVPNQQVRPILVEFDVVFPIGNANPGTTDLKLVLRERANTSGLSQWIQLWDWQSGTWTTSPNYALTMTEQVYEASFTNLAPYFEPDTTHVRARIAVGVTGPVNVSAFCVFLDQFEFQSDTQ